MEKVLRYPSSLTVAGTPVQRIPDPAPVIVGTGKLLSLRAPVLERALLADRRCEFSQHNTRDNLEVFFLHVNVHFRLLC